MARTIAVALKVRRQRVDRILTRPHVAALAEDFRKPTSAHGLLRNGDLDCWLGES